MTNATTNGASLEDCLTNIFSLIDLNGIRWKRFKHKENNNYLYTPIDTHPVLITYAKCIEENHIAVWRNEPQKRPANGQSGAGGGGGGGANTGQSGGGPGNNSSAGHSNFPTPTRTSNNNTPTSAGPNNTNTTANTSGNQGNNNSGSGGTSGGGGPGANNTSQTNNYELWIFGYGNQLRVDNVIGEDLVEIEDDNWESKGLSYECRSLLFKALHNLIERCLINKGFTRIGRWFVQPSLSADNHHLHHHHYHNNQHQHHQHHHHHHSNSHASGVNNSSQQHSTFNSGNFYKPFKQPKLEQNSIISTSSPSSSSTSTTKASLSSSISSTINRIIESRREIYDSRQCLDKTDGLRHPSGRSSSTYFTSSLDGSKLSLSFAFNFFVHGDSNVCANVDVRQHPLVHPLTRADLTAFQEGGIVRVALAPFGLNGILNGVSYKDSDNGAATTTFTQQWSRFYPLPKTLARLVPGNKSSISAMSNFNQKTPSANNSNQFNQSNDGQSIHASRSYLSNLTNMLLPPSQKPFLYFNHEPNEVPPVVEVIVAGYRMRYPSECVFTTSKIVDPYKSLSAPSNSRSASSFATKRPSKHGFGKPNKLSLLCEKLKDDDKQLDSQTKNKMDPNRSKAPQDHDNSFKLISSIDGNSKLIPKLEGSTTTATTITPTINNNDTIGADNPKDKITNGCPENLDISTTTTAATTLSVVGNQTTISRFNSTKVGFGSNNNPLGPTDLVKLFPTPPSLEQVVLSPSNTVEEQQQLQSVFKESTTLSPITLIQNNSYNNNNNNDFLKDNGVDVYKPVECALMPPPSKWAALTNIMISSSKTLPPECIYKGSPQNTGKNIINKLNDNTSKSSMSKNISGSKQFNSLLIKNSTNIGSNTSNNLQSISSPLTDQTNKNGFNNLNLSTSSPKTTPIGVTSLLSTTTTPSITNFNNSSNGTLVTASATFSSFTLPHQRLFNNLNEVNSIQLNLMISDSALGMFKDHNFDSCTICVCNMSIKGTQTDTLPQRTDISNQWRQSIGNDSAINNPSTTNEFVNECTCGFSAITNRHCSHLSGLFLEDELELTNVLYDPTEMIDQNKLFRKIRLSNYSETSYTDEQKMVVRLMTESNTKANSTDDSIKSGSKPDRISRDDKSSHSSQIFEDTKIFVIDQLKQQCSCMVHSNSSLSKVLLIESFRNNRHLTSCSNYFAQTTTNKTGPGSPFYRFLDESNKYTTVKMMNRNPMSLRFSDFCELAKSIITKLGSQSQTNPRLASSLVKPLGPAGSSGLSSIFTRMFGSGRQSLIGKSNDPHSNNRNNIFIQGLQALVVPTLSVDPNGALQMLEHLAKEEEARVTLNKAILILSSPIHDWQFLNAPIPENNFDVANLLKILQPSLYDSIGSHNKLYKDFVHQQQQHIFSARDSPTGAPTVPTPPCQGPLTWRQFHQAAGRGTEDQCEPQPIPSLLVCHHIEKNHLALSPFAIKFWDKLMLEPYSPGHNLFYIVISPDNQSILAHVDPFFKELSNMYDIMKLGKHSPIGNGIILAANSSSSTENAQDDEWFSHLSYGDKDFSSGIVSLLKCYAAKLNSNLAKTIVEFMDDRQPPYDPHADRFDSSPSAKSSTNLSSNTRPNPPPQSVNRTFSSLLSSSTSNVASQQQENFPFGTESQMQAELLNQSKSQTLVNSAYVNPEDYVNPEEEANRQSGIVIYIVDPFSSPSINRNLRTLAITGLFKCYSMLLDNLPENIRRITQLQLISLDSIISNSRPIFNISRVDQLKSLSMNIYSRCRKILTNHTTAKSLTGFGPAAALEAFFKTKNADLSITKMFTPPFILAPMKDKQTELGEMFGDRRERSSVLFCSYCITEDQRWLLASVTNDKGEMSDTTVININIIDRMKRPKTSVKRIALRKLMEFIVSVMSEWTNPWRLIIGKLGRVGHGELKEWATLMSKRSLLNYSRHLTERCRQCSILPATETVSILSACLVSLEPDSKLRIMPDQFTTDDRQASFNKCPLSTPKDASTTHILVFPTSASIQSSHGNVEDPLAGSGLDDDLLNQFPLEDGIEDLGVEENMDDLFSSWNDDPPNVSDHINSHHDTMMSSSNLQMGSGSVGDNTNNQDETLQLLQQPLALGYYISTAKIGQMPNWFWSTSPHLRDSCPYFLKSALHIHMPCVQLSDDLLHSGVGQSRKSHQLDSNLTTDVLRYVLEGYNSLSWLALDPITYDRQSCLPVHMQNLLQLYHLMESFS